MKQLTCTYCGWKSKLYPDGTLFAGPGGTLSCPDCGKNKVNGPFIEGAYGNVKVISIGPFKGWKINHSRKQHLIHYFLGDKAVCGAKVSSGGEYLIKEHWTNDFSAKCLEDWGKAFCPKCEASVGGKGT